jgi:predicted alpha/beta-fold hydrolase
MPLVTLQQSLQYAGDHPVATTLTALLLVTTLVMPPARLLGISKAKYWHSSRPLDLKTKDGNTTTFPNFCKSLVPTCRLNPFLFNGHLQTIWTVVKSQHIPIYYKRRIFEHQDPVYTGQFTVDFVTAPTSAADPNLPPRTTYYSEDEFRTIASDDTRPMLVVLHGLKGGSHEIYVRHVLEPLVGNGGWEACVVNSRGCSMSKITTSVLYNARATWDVGQTVKWLRETFPNRPLFGIGFSLGANIITNVGFVDS